MFFGGWGFSGNWYYPAVQQPIQQSNWNMPAATVYSNYSNYSNNYSYSPGYNYQYQYNYNQNYNQNFNYNQNQYQQYQYGNYGNSYPTGGGWWY